MTNLCNKRSKIKRLLFLFLCIVTLSAWILFGLFVVKNVQDNVILSFDQVNSEGSFIEQNDPRLIKYIWNNKLLLPPSDKPYNLKAPNIDPSRGQGQFIRRILKNMKEGFFIEAGALDGETRSNTLYMERNLNWKGLLVEGDPKNFALIKTKKRKAWISNTCLAVKPQPHMAEYLQSFNLGKIINDAPDNDSMTLQSDVTKVQCMPVFTLLSALNITTVDYFSLDVEGSELKVLKTIPFDKVFIKTLSIEFEHTDGGKKGILEFMKSKGFVLAGHIGPPKYSYANDVILVHKTTEYGTKLLQKIV